MSFNKGNIVRLKSGGPPMTVRGNPHKGADSQDYYVVDWFTSDGLHQTGEFRKEQLEKVEQKTT